VADLILALDVTDPAEALAVAAKTAETIDQVKVGYPLVLHAGLPIVRELARLGLPLIADFKVADIPATNTLITEAAFSAGFDAIICQGFPGRDSITACVDAAHAHGGACYVVAEMSHPGATECFGGGTAERIAEMACTSGADGIIAPATRPDRVAVLRRIIGARKIYSPGVGAQGGDASAVAPLVDGVIVGRAIYADPDPATRAKEYSVICR
jgi:orotidine-5'-phosphate decarboxylase